MAQVDYSVIRTNGDLPDPAVVKVGEIIEELWEVYVDSATTMLADIEQAAMSLEAGNNVEENSATIRRILHSLKGDSGVSGIHDVYRLCHETEFAFEEIADLSQSADMILRVKDWIEAAINHISSGDSQQQDVTDVETVEQNDAPSFDDSGDANDPNKIKALIVDDEAVCRMRVEMIASDFCNFTIATNGREGFEIFERELIAGNPFKLVTLDIEMPEMDGHATLEAIRLLERQNDINGLDGAKVIMLTSRGEAEHVFAAFRQGCESYVVKRDMGEKLPEEMAKLGLLKTKTNYALS